MKKGKDGTCGNLYVHFAFLNQIQFQPPIELEEHSEGWIKLIEEAWTYANFDSYFKVKDVVYNLQLKITNRHGRIKNLNIYTDEQQTQKLEQYDEPLCQVFFTKGAQDRQHAPLFKIYYSFDPALDCPLLLTGIK